MCKGKYNHSSENYKAEVQKKCVKDNRWKNLNISLD